MQVWQKSSPLRIAIVGGGPGGLATAIQISRLVNIELSLFEAARELREIGAVCLSMEQSRTGLAKTCGRESISTKIHGDFWMILVLLNTLSLISLRSEMPTNLKVSRETAIQENCLENVSKMLPQLDRLRNA